MEKKSLQERWDEEVLSDNTQFEKCSQCKECVFQSDGTVWSNSFNKSCCQKYPYPKVKPIGVINNSGKCPHRKMK